MALILQDEKAAAFCCFASYSCTERTLALYVWKSMSMGLRQFPPKTLFPIFSIVGLVTSKMVIYG